MQAVTVFSIWHNREYLVEQSITSILEQTYTDVRFVFIDDGSTDNTSAVIREVCNRYPTRSITVITQTNLGLVTTLQAAVAEDDSDFFALHGAGDVSHPERIAKQMDMITSSDHIAVVGCNVGFTDGRSQTLTASRAPADVPVNSDFRRRIPRPGTHGAAVVRRAMYERSGGYRTVFRYAQDVDLWLRINAFGSFRICNHLLYWKYVGSDTVRGGSVVKRIAQKKYSELALYSRRTVLNGREDPVKTYGADALFVTPRTKRFRSAVMQLAYKCCKCNDVEGAAKAIEAISYRPSIVRLLPLALSTRPSLRFVIKIIKLWRTAEYR